MNAGKKTAKCTLSTPPALDRLKDLSANAETRRRAFVRERALLDEARAINAATAQGIQQGVHQGEADTLGQLDLWTERILDAPNLPAIFTGH